MLLAISVTVLTPWLLVQAARLERSSFLADLHGKTVGLVTAADCLLL